LLFTFYAVHKYASVNEKRAYNISIWWESLSFRKSNNNVIMLIRALSLFVYKFKSAKYDSTINRATSYDTPL